MADGLRVLVVATQVRLPDTHGGSTHVGELVRHLAERGPTQVLARRGSTDPRAIGVSGRFVPTPVWKHLRPALALPRALRAARAFRPEVIYERASSYGLGALLSHALGVPLLAMVLDEHVSPLTLRRAGRVVATNPKLVPASARAKTVKVSWGANTRLFRPDLPREAARARLGVTGSVVLYVGSFKRWHGLEQLLEVDDRLGRPATLTYLLVGDGPCRGPLEEAARARGLAGRFRFLGAVPYEAVPELVAAADLCVAPFEPRLHPYSSDGFALDPLKLFEYLAMARPTISADTANIRALFAHEEHLLLVPPGDPASLAAAMTRVLADPDRARAMAERGRAKVLAEHTWARHVEQLYALFHELLAESR